MYMLFYHVHVVSTTTSTTPLLPTPLLSMFLLCFGPMKGLFDGLEVGLIKRFAGF